MNFIYVIFSFILSLLLIIIYYFFLVYLDLIFYLKSMSIVFKQVYYDNFNCFLIIDIFDKYNNIISVLKINDDSIINIINNKQLSELVSYFIDNSFNKVFVTLIKILNLCVS